MKLLIVSRQERARSFDTLFAGLTARFAHVDVHKLSKLQVHDIRPYLKQTDFSAWDRVLFDIPLRRMGKAAKALRNVQGLVFYEEDACQELVAESKFRNQFATGFKQLSNARIIVTSYYMRDYFKQRGIDAWCIPKAYDDAVLDDLGAQRDIPLGFIGRTKSQVYNERRNLLENMGARCGLQTLRTQTPDEYLRLLNRIAVFLSADIGFNEYMAKNFEAMGCGCLLMAKRQPSEDGPLGLIDMHNVVHYDSLDEALAKYQQLQADPDALKRIATNGLALVRERHRLSQRTPDFAQILQMPALNVPHTRRTWYQRITEWLPGKFA